MKRCARNCSPQCSACRRQVKIKANEPPTIHPRYHHISVIAKLTERFRGRAKTRNERRFHFAPSLGPSLSFLPLSFCRLFSPLGVLAKGETTTDLLRGARRNSCGECPYTHMELDVKSRSPNTRVQLQKEQGRREEQEDRERGSGIIVFWQNSPKYKRGSCLRRRMRKQSNRMHTLRIKYSEMIQR